MSDHVIDLADLGKDDTERVGGKAANLGELARIGVPVLPGFTTTSEAYDHYIDATGIRDDIEEALSGLNIDDVESLQETGERIRTLIEEAAMPDDLKDRILDRYRTLAEEIGVENPAVAVRSSATAEDLPGASFAGQQETFLNVSGEEDLIEAVKGCYASLFTDRAISYREDKGFNHFDVKLAAVVQKMGRSDEAGSGVMFTIDPDTGFEDAVVIEAAYGFGELVVQGEVNPDEYMVFKPTDGILEKMKGDKAKRMVVRDGVNTIEEVPQEERERYVLTDDQIHELARYAAQIEEHYDRPMDIEWLLDGDLDELFIVQARPETVQSEKEENVIRTYRLNEESRVLVEGVSIGEMIGTGTVKILDSPRQMDQFEEGDVLVTTRTDPDWEPIMKEAGAIVTDKGGKTSHAAIVSRELGVPAIVGAEDATRKLRDGEEITVDCTHAGGKVWEGLLDYTVQEEHIDNIPDTDTEIMLILGDPTSALNLSHLPVDGVGLAREEFIIASNVGEHPLHLLQQGEEEKFISTLASGIAKIAAAFHPNDVIVRLSDFKTDEYRGLEGGTKYEPEEANPMLGWRGAARYYDPDFKDAFAMECEALRRVRDEIGLDNVVVMVPFCRTPDEGEKVVDIMQENGLEQGENGLDVYVMAELPTNIIRADEFAQVFDGFSIGTNDLTQLTLGVDRNSEKLAYLFDEDDKAVKESVRTLIQTAHDNDTKVGLCGDAPSTVEGYAQFLVEAGIDSLSVSPDKALETIMTVAEVED